MCNKRDLHINTLLNIIIKIVIFLEKIKKYFQVDVFDCFISQMIKFTTVKSFKGSFKDVKSMHFIILFHHIVMK